MNIQQFSRHNFSHVFFFFFVVTCRSTEYQAPTYLLTSGELGRLRHLRLLLLLLPPWPCDDDELPMLLSVATTTTFTWSFLLVLLGDHVLCFFFFFACLLFSYSPFLFSIRIYISKIFLFLVLKVKFFVVFYLKRFCKHLFGIF